MSVEDRDHAMKMRGLKVAMDANLDQCLAHAREGITRNPDEDPLTVIFKQLHPERKHNPQGLLMVIAHMTLRLIKQEDR
jgi:hypothetical protein